MFVPQKPFQDSAVFGVRQGPTQVKHLSGALLQGRLLALPKNNRPGLKGLPGANALPYYENSLLTFVKSFKILAPGTFTIKLFTAVIVAVVVIS